MAEHDSPSPYQPIRSRFRLVADSLCRPGAAIPDSGATKDEGKDDFLKSYAQVDPMVAPGGRASAEPKHGRRLHPLGVRFSAAEIEIVRRKARDAGCTVNSYIRAAALGSDYKPPVHQELRLTLLASNRELTAIGRNINQIAKQLNSGISPYALLSAHSFGKLQTDLIITLTTVRAALARKQP